jgi:hypothetical protein
MTFNDLSTKYNTYYQRNDCTNKEAYYKVYK